MSSLMIFQYCMIGNFRQPRLPKVMGPKSWTTSLVHGEPKDFGRLPHPPGTLGMAEADDLMVWWL